MAAGTQSSPALAANARATASSNAADDDRPAPSGTSDTSTPSSPLSRCPCAWSAQATPFAYSPHPVPLSIVPMRKSAGSVALVLCRITRSSSRGRTASQTACSIASGITKPSL